jgi:hypothetical protein
MPASRYEKLALAFFRARNLPLTAYNKQLDGVRYRPDFIFQKDKVAVVVECDENQHDVGYDPMKEEIREDIILTRLRGLGYSRAVLIRYDPHPEGCRPCARMAVVSDMVQHILRGQCVEHLLWRDCIIKYRDDKYVVY